MFAAIAAFCTVFCGTQLGWGHLFTVIGLVACGVSMVGFVWGIVKLLRVRNHRLFRKYGSAEVIAEYITQGLHNPRYLGRRSPSTFDLLITDRFIVNSGNYHEYLELKDIRKIQPNILTDSPSVLLMGNPAMSVASTVAVNYAKKSYMESHSITENNRYDNLRITDNDGVAHYYSVPRPDMGAVLQLLKELAPHAEIVMPQR